MTVLLLVLLAFLCGATATAWVLSLVALTRNARPTPPAPRPSDPRA